MCVSPAAQLAGQHHDPTISPPSSCQASAGSESLRSRGCGVCKPFPAPAELAGHTARPGPRSTPGRTQGQRAPLPQCDTAILLEINFANLCSRDAYMLPSVGACKVADSGDATKLQAGVSQPHAQPALIGVRAQRSRKQNAEIFVRNPHTSKGQLQHVFHKHKGSLSADDSPKRSTFEDHTPLHDRVERFHQASCLQTQLCKVRTLKL